LVNNIRSLLLNTLPWTGTARLPGEDYIAATFTPRILPPDLSRLRGLLFGSGVDRVGANLTVGRILAYLHASQFALDVIVNDPRITYDPLRPAAVFDKIGPSATGPTPIAGWAGMTAFSAAGRAYGTWAVTTNGTGGYTIAFDGISLTGSVTTSNAGDIIWLPGSELGLVVPTGAAGVWTATLLVPPTHAFTSAALAPDASSVFRPSTPGSEARWASVWAGDGPAPDRAAALALAIAARTKELGSS
jgi:hypothetical protein